MIENFEWPEYNREADRIRHNTQKYKDCSIEESFNDYYNIDIQTSAEDHYYELNPGDTVMLKVLSIDSSGINFDNGKFKENIVCKINTHKYPNIHEYVDKTGYLTCLVISKNSKQTVVDPIEYLRSEFINMILPQRMQCQANINSAVPTKVYNLKLVRGGFIGEIRIDNISDMVGKDIFMNVFIPGSQIALNIEKDFESWIGKDINTFIIGIDQTAQNDQYMIICSRKEFLKHVGNINIINIFKNYTEENENWNQVKSTSFEGIVTGICHTQNKCGVFIEIPSIMVTGMVNCEPDELSHYKAGDKKNVKITGFNEPLIYNSDVDQYQHIAPYVINNEILEECNIKCILEFSD